MSPEKRWQQHPVPPQKRPTVMTAAQVTWIWMTNLAHQRSPDSWLPKHSLAPPQSLPSQETPPQHPSSGPIPLYPGHVNQKFVHHYRKSRPPHKHRTTRDLGSVAVGTQFRRQRHRTTGKLGGLMCDRGGQPQGHDSPGGTHSDPGAYQHSQDTLGQILDKFQEKMRLQEGQYLGIREDLKDTNTTLVSIAGVLVDMANTMREAVAHHQVPDTSQTDEQPFTSFAASGQEAPPQDQQATSTPPPAEGEPPRKRSLQSRQKPQTIAKTPARK
ncbi:hypothetical protein NDU88_010430 [Pleurodeles waltl]|uniref:Uncharacterized protein n=1 Tax=Pleurodeles waltl TaxID=8319 RepID=A0AAV7QVQ0_PLEWA|nr:hypothetical protein NDU88_010430 [Pleurodeles waltl]